MRVALNALAVSPERPGGDATYVRDLARQLPRVGPDDEWVLFVTPEARRLFPPAAPNARYVECPLPSRSLVVRALWEQAALPAWVRRARPDLLHAPINVAPLAARLPVVLTVHEAEPFMPGHRIPLPLLAWWRLTRRRSAWRAARVLTVSRSARADIVRWMGLPAERVRVVHLGVDPDRFSPAGRGRPLGGRRYLLWVGRPYPGKNLPRLVAAFAQLRRAGRDEALVLAGPPGWLDREVAAAVAAHGCGDAVLRRPALGEELADWYRGASAFVYPSRRESFGLPILEALACATPVVAGDIPALREVGGDAVAYVDPADVDRLAELLLRVLRDPAYAGRLGAAGPPRAALFPAARTAAQTYAHYREVLGR